MRSDLKWDFRFSIFVGVMIVLFFVIWLKKRSQGGDVGAAVVSQIETSAKVPAIDSVGIPTGKSSAESGIPVPQSQPQNTVATTPPPVPPMVAESIRVQTEFQKIAQANIPLPEDLIYRDLEIDDKMASVYGFNSATKVGLSMLAYPKEATPKEAIDFFRESASLFPNTAEERIVNVNEPREMPAAPGSGIRGATWWSGETQAGTKLHIVLIRRSDGMGSYMMVMTGPPAYFDNNEDRFEQMFNRFKTQPAR
jgi:hypothetical protein